MARYFKGLDTLRAIAAFIVVWSHIELFKKKEGVPNLHESDFPIFPGGHIGVILFFVLSGFLITYLLVKEKEKNNSISLKKFYMRRVLRIWPLYYLILLISFLLSTFLFDVKYSVFTILLCLTFFPNIAHALGIGWSGSPQVWSIGVEEQFYLFWPILLIKIPQKKIIQFLVVFFIFYTLLPDIIYLINKYTIVSGKLSSFSGKFFYGTKFNCMALGAIMGVALAKNQKWISYLSKKSILTSIIIVAILLTFLRIDFKFSDELSAIFYALMIVGIVESKEIKIDSKPTIFLGKISYGIYMYHWVVIILVIQILPIFDNLILYNIVLYTAIIGLTIFISWCSFNTIEKYFLNIKKKFEVKN